MDKETRRMFGDVFKMLESITKQLQSQAELNEQMVGLLVDDDNNYLDQDINV